MPGSIHHVAALLTFLQLRGVAGAVAATSSTTCASPGTFSAGSPLEANGSCAGGKPGQSFLQTYGRTGHQEVKTSDHLGPGRIASSRLIQMRAAAARHFLKTSVLRQDLSSFDDSFYNCYDPDMNRTENARHCFVEFCRSSGLDDEMNATEKAIFQANFVDAMDDCVALPTENVAEQAATWRVCMKKRVQQVKPVCSTKLVESVNSADVTWKAKTDGVCERMMMSTAADMLGTLVDDQDWDDMRNDVAEKKFGLVQHVQIDGEFDSRENWPECKETIGHVRDQGQCGDCWAMAAAGVVEDRLCIASNGAFAGPAAYISGGFIASCGNEAKDGCTGGFVRKALIWAAEHGVPTGGPGTGSHTCVPYFASGDSLNHFFAASHHSPPCPSMCTNKRYTRSLDADRFHPEGFRDTIATSSFDQAVSAIRSSGPIAFAFKVYSDFMSYESGIYKPAENAEYLGFHAANAIGFGSDYILGVNSWDRAWGDQGLFRIHKSAVSTYWLPGPIVGKGPGYPFPIPGSNKAAPETDCFHKGQVYMPLDMRGAELTHEKDVEACQARCAATNGCAYFSFWNDGTHDGDCHLAAAEASPLREDVWANVTTGPAACDSAKDEDDALYIEWKESIARSEEAAAQAQCWLPHDKCQEMFVYKGETISGCTLMNDVRGWCSYDVEFNDNTSQWSYCTWNCLNTTTATTTTATPAPADATTPMPASVTLPNASSTATTTATTTGAPAPTEGPTPPPEGPSPSPTVAPTLVINIPLDGEGEGNASISEEDIVRTAEAAADAAIRGAASALDDMYMGDISADRCWVPADPCAERFEYMGVNYTGCITLDNEGMPWCAHTAVFETGSWSNCACTCWEMAPDCVGAFKFNDQFYTGCTSVNAGPSAWCSLDAVFMPGRWRSCTSLCNVVAITSSGAFAADAAVAAAPSGASAEGAREEGTPVSSAYGPYDEGEAASSVFGGLGSDSDGGSINSTPVNGTPFNATNGSAPNRSRSLNSTPVDGTPFNATNGSAPNRSRSLNSTPVNGTPFNATNGSAPNRSRPGKSDSGKKAPGKQAGGDSEVAASSAPGNATPKGAKASGKATPTENEVATEAMASSSKGPLDVVMRGSTGNVDATEDGTENGTAGETVFTDEDNATTLKAAGECWRPTRNCVSGFTFKGTSYEGCIYKAGQKQAWCAHEENPGLRGSWSPCVCECWIPDSRCAPVFEYNSMQLTGCVPDIKKTNSAWCSLHEAFHVGDTAQCTSGCYLD